MSYLRSTDANHALRQNATQMSPEITKQRLADIRQRLDHVSASASKNNEKLRDSTRNALKIDPTASPVRLFPNGTHDLSSYSSPAKENMSPSYKKYTQFDLTLNGNSANTPANSRKRERPYSRDLLSPRKEKGRYISQTVAHHDQTHEKGTSNSSTQLTRSVSLKPPAGDGDGRAKVLNSLVNSRTRSLQISPEPVRTEGRSLASNSTFEINSSRQALDLSIEHATPSILSKPLTSTSQAAATNIEKLKAQQSMELASKDAQLSGKDTEIKILRQRLQVSEELVHSYERQKHQALKSAIETISDDLHKKYQAKFETRIEELKKTLSKKSKREMNSLRETLTRDFAQVRQELEKENMQLKEELSAKDSQLTEIISLWEEFQRLAA